MKSVSCLVLSKLANRPFLLPEPSTEQRSLFRTALGSLRRGEMKPRPQARVYIGRLKSKVKFFGEGGLAHLGMTHWQPLSQHLQQTTTLKLPRQHRSPCSRRQVLSLFLFPKNVVPVVLVGFRYWLLTLAHTLLFLFGVRFVFSLGRGFRLGFDNLVLGDWFF